MAGEAAHVCFIDDTIDQRDVELLIVPPVEKVFNHYTVPFGMGSVLVGSPRRAIRYHTGVGIEHAASGIKALDLRFRVGLHVEAKSIVRASIESFNEDVPHLTDTVDVRVQRDFANN